MAYSGRWNLTHAATGRALTADPLGFLDDVHDLAEHLATLGLDWTHPDPRQWPAAAITRVTTAIRAHLTGSHR